MLKEIQLENLCAIGGAILMLAFYMLYVAIRRRQALLQIKQNRQEIRSLLLRQQELEERNRWLTDKTVRLEAELNLQSVRQLTTSNLLNKEDENVFRQSFAILHPFSCRN